MLSYPSIPTWRKSQGLNKNCLAFNKYDGSNLRWEWSPKRNWYKFGSRTQLFDHSHPVFSEAIELFHNTMAEQIRAAICDNQRKKVERIVAFTEFLGDNSFAGSHVETDPKRLVLIDVSVYKQGFLDPVKFLHYFDQKEWAAKLLYDGPMTEEFIENVRHGGYNIDKTKICEGVICKGEGWNAKIKTYEYINKLKNRFGDDWEQYGE